jgi:plasmid stability protein
VAQLLVRKIDSNLVALLKKRAATTGRSVEEEHRLILREALTGVSAEDGPLTLEQYLVSNPQEDLELLLPNRNHPSERAIDLS